MRVTTVNDDVTLLKVGLELSDEVIDGLTGLDKEDDSSRGLELGAELLDGVGTDNVGSLGLVLEEVVDLGGGSAGLGGLQRSRSRLTGCRRRP